RNIRNGILVRHEFTTLQSSVKHTIESMSFLEKPLLRVRSFAFVIFYEMVDFAKHRSGSSPLPHQPFEHAVTRFALLRQQLSGLVGQIDHQCRRFHEADPGVAVDYGRDAVVRTDLEKL